MNILNYIKGYHRTFSKKLLTLVSGDIYASFNVDENHGISTIQKIEEDNIKADYKTTMGLLTEESLHSDIAGYLLEKRIGFDQLNKNNEIFEDFITFVTTETGDSYKTCPLRSISTIKEYIIEQITINGRRGGLKPLHEELRYAKMNDDDKEFATCPAPRTFLKKVYREAFLTYNQEEND